MPEGLQVFLTLAVIATLVAAALVAVPLLRTGEANISAFLVALAVPACALMLYLAGSNYGWTSAGQVVPAAAGMPDIDAARARLEARLQQEPDDRDGWLLLGNTYLQLQRPADAERAFTQALALADGKDNIAKLGVAESRVLQDRDALAGDPGGMIEEVLADEPNNAKALWYGGLVALARGDRQSVQARWERLLQQDVPEPIRVAINQQLQNLGLASTSAPAAAGEGTAIDVRVSVSDALREQMAPDALLFLVARDASGGGPPVAAVRQQASGLPRTVRISDANAMLAGRNLSQLENVRLIARVSNAGGAIAQPGDVFGETTWSPGEGPVSIVMDQVVEP
jgi:cytochrome c-type biogenesis protein CcmH